MPYVSPLPCGSTATGLRRRRERAFRSRPRGYTMRRLARFRSMIWHLTEVRISAAPKEVHPAVTSCCVPGQPSLPPPRRGTDTFTIFLCQETSIPVAATFWSPEWIHPIRVRICGLSCNHSPPPQHTDSSQREPSLQLTSSLLISEANREAVR